MSGLDDALELIHADARMKDGQPVFEDEEGAPLFCRDSMYVKYLNLV
jgi:hypothetical protein